MATKEKRKLKDLNLLDKFLFDEAMEDEENMKTLLDIILGQDTHLKQPPQTEKECRSSFEKRQIRLDVYTVDEDDVVYDTEPQKTNTKNLPKRSRLYQGMIDSRLLPPGCIDFNLLNPEMELGDDATRIFLNSHGKHPELVSRELIELLEYMEKSTDAVVEECESERIHQMHERVNRLKSSKEMEIKFMQKWEEKEMERQEAYAEGREEGERVGEARINKLIVYLLEQGRNKDLAKAVSDSEYQAKLLKELGL